MKSARDLYIYTLENALGVVGVGQPVPEEDINTLRKALPAMLSELRATDMANVTVNQADESYECVPDEYLGPLADLLANEVAASYGKTPFKGAERDILIWRIARVTANGPRYYPQQVEYF